jgi:hypothetical protein
MVTHGVSYVDDQEASRDQSLAQASQGLEATAWTYPGPGRRENRRGTAHVDFLGELPPQAIRPGPPAPANGFPRTHLNRSLLPLTRRYAVRNITTPSYAVRNKPGGGTVMDRPVAEVSRAIEGFDGYFACRDGTIWSHRCRRWKKLAALRRDYGCRYMVVCLRPARTAASKLCCRYVHRLVLEAFVGPCPDGMVCCHGDGDTSNNALGNLRWDTSAANAADTEKHGRHHKGSRVRGAKLREEDIPEIFRLRRLGFLLREIAVRYAVRPATIGDVIRRKKWRHIEVPGVN